MSTLKVEVVRIDGIIPHPNADKLELAQVKGWQCVVQKGSFVPGSAAIYFPVDAVLSEETEKVIFGSDSKVKLHHHRVKTIKLRGAISQGLLAPLSKFNLTDEIGTDLTQKLGVTKYEPEVPLFQASKGSRKVVNSNTNFHRYTSIENIKNYHKLFSPEDVVVITEKIHGTSARFGWVKKAPKNSLHKAAIALGLMSEWEFLVGSHNIEREHNDGSVYAQIAAELRLKEILPKGFVLYGEIYGPSIQRGYRYGCKPGEVKFAAFDLKVNGVYLSCAEFKHLTKLMNLPTVPILFSGQIANTNLEALVGGDSVLDSSQKIREGIVIKSKYEENCMVGRKILKHINPEYALKDNTEFH
jgi:RNA ligase (TIGR02306 family)